MIHLDSVRVALPLKKMFKVSQGEALVKTNLLTIMNNRYYGETSGSVHYGPELDVIEKDMAVGLEHIRNFSEITQESIEYVSGLDISPFARSALVGMLLNYLSGEMNRYPWEIIGLGTPIGIKSSYTISIDDPGSMIESIQKSEYPIIKIKMGNEEDVMILDVLDKIKNKQIRIDANGGWSCAKAEEMIYSLSQKGVKIIEQPTKEDFISEWKHLKSKSPEVELFIDEGLNCVEDYQKQKDNIDGVNIKMEKCGGILEGMEIAQAARMDNKKVMLGCMVESSVGIAQSVYMSSMADYYDLDGPLLLENDIANGITFDKESISVDREIIGGPKLKRDVLEKYISK